MLTSGQAVDVHYGAETICQMIDFAHGAIEILPGGGIKKWNIDRILAEIPCTQIHVSKSSEQLDRSTAGNPAIHFGGALYPPEDRYAMTDAAAVAELRARADRV